MINHLLIDKKMLIQINQEMKAFNHNQKNHKINKLMFWSK